MPTQQDLTTPNTPNWCPGCGDFGIWAAFKNACVQQGWDNSNTAITAGIGCHGHIVNFVKITAVEGLHGRPIPVASGIKFANHHLNVFAFTGDGDCLERQHAGLYETRRHYTNYFKGIPHFKEYRLRMVTAESKEAVFEVFDEVLEKFSA